MVRPITNVEQIVINTKVVDDVCSHNTDFGTSYSQPECAADGATDMSKNMAGSFENVAGNEGMEANVSGMESQQANKLDNDQTCDVLGDKVWEANFFFWYESQARQANKLDNDQTCDVLGDKVVRSVIFDTQGGDASGHGDGSKHVYVGNPPKKSILKKSNVAARHIDNTQELFVSVRGQQRSHVGLKSVKNDPKDAGNLMQEEQKNRLINLKHEVSMAILRMMNLVILLKLFRLNLSGSRLIFVECENHCTSITKLPEKRKAVLIHTDRPMDEQAVGFTTNLAAKTFIFVVNHEEGLIEVRSRIYKGKGAADQPNSPQKNRSPLRPKDQ
ncbi:hypothetical protein Tco_0004924 [Tanacetum coccineum]